MLIPPTKVQKILATKNMATEESVQLRSSHIWIKSDLALALFDRAPNVDLVFYAQRNQLFIASSADMDFKKLHKSKQYMLKNRNAAGDRTIALHELIIDNDINNVDRALEVEYDLNLKILKVNF